MSQPQAPKEEENTIRLFVDPSPANSAQYWQQGTWRKGNCSYCKKYRPNAQKPSEYACDIDQAINEGKGVVPIPIAHKIGIKDDDLKFLWLEKCAQLIADTSDEFWSVPIDEAAMVFLYAWDDVSDAYWICTGKTSVGIVKQSCKYSLERLGQRDTKLSAHIYTEQLAFPRHAYPYSPIGIEPYRPYGQHKP